MIPEKKFDGMIEHFFNLNNVLNFPKNDDSKYNKNVEEYENDGHLIKKETWESVDGNEFFKRVSYESKRNPNEEKENREKIANLRKELDVAIKNENFEKAIKLRDEIKNLENKKISS